MARRNKTHPNRQNTVCWPSGAGHCDWLAPTGGQILAHDLAISPNEPDNAPAHSGRGSSFATAVLLLGMVPIMYLSQFVSESVAVVIALIPLGVLLFWWQRVENWLKRQEVDCFTLALLASITFTTTTPELLARR